MDSLKQTPYNDHCQGYYQAKCKILRKCNDFMRNHELGVVIKKLPYKNAESITSHPMYFIFRQKRHIVDQMLMNRSFYETSYNKKTDPLNANSVYKLGKISESVLEHLQIMSNDIMDAEFSGIWVGIYSKTYISKTQIGDIHRSKLISWALVELLTTNERCFKGLWVHPFLNNFATCALLKVFLPRIILASFDTSLERVDPSYNEKLFYVWAADIDSFPRISLALLACNKRLGLRRHFEHSVDGNGKERGKYVGTEKSHTDNGNSESKCYCQKSAIWDETDNIIMACSEEMMCKNADKWLANISINEPNLTRCIKDILSSHCDSIYMDEKDDRCYDEIDNLDIEKDLHAVLKTFYGSTWANRLKRKDGRKRLRN